MKLYAFKIILIINVLVASFAFSDVIEIGNIELKSLLQKKIPLIDIRREDEWKSTGIVENSILMTFFDKNGKANTNEWLKELNKIANKNDPVILICRTGRRTGIISKFLSEKVGYRLIYDVTDGITDWIKKGNTVVNPY
ncbi:MAG: rhodanese-like domain-containing protein [Pseudomonadota bacterium]|nr:rhodanese-like domain-containing protein [Pseudomonadota bacterium]